MNANLGPHARGWAHGEIFNRRRRQVRAWRLAGLLLVVTTGAAFWLPWLAW